MTSQLTPHQQREQATADALGREFLTQIDGRIALILRPRSDQETARLVAKLLREFDRLDGDWL